MSLLPIPLPLPSAAPPALQGDSPQPVVAPSMNTDDVFDFSRPMVIACGNFPSATVFGAADGGAPTLARRFDIPVPSQPVNVCVHSIPATEDNVVVAICQGQSMRRPHERRTAVEEESSITLYYVNGMSPVGFPLTGHRGSISAFHAVGPSSAVSESGCFVSGDGASQLFTWNPSTLQQTAILPDAPARTLSITGGGGASSTVYVSGSESVLKCYDLSTETSVGSFAGAGGSKRVALWDISLHEEKKLLFAVGSHSKLTCYSAETSEQQQNRPLYHVNLGSVFSRPAAAYCVLCVEDRNCVLVGTAAGTVEVWDLRNAGEGKPSRLSSFRLGLAQQKGVVVRSISRVSGDRFVGVLAGAGAGGAGAARRQNLVMFGLDGKVVSRASMLGEGFDCCVVGE